MAKEQDYIDEINKTLYCLNNRTAAYNAAHGIVTQTTTPSLLDIASDLVTAGVSIHNSIQNIKSGTSSSGTSTTSSYPGGGRSAASGGDYISQYRRWEGLAQRHYNSLTNTGLRVSSSTKESGTSGSISSSNYNMQKKALRDAQREMQRIRTKAAQSGVNITQSRWETASVGL